MKIRKAYLDFRGADTQGQSEDMVSLIKRRKQYLEDLRNKVSDASKFPSEEDDKQSADSLIYAFGRLERIAEAHSNKR